jgi:phage-related protein
LDKLREPHVKHLEGKLWELRAKASEGIARGIYVTVTGRKVIVLHVFVKTSRKTPKGALECARERMKKMKL